MSAPHDFLRALYGDDCPGYLAVWRNPSKLTDWVPASDLDAAVAFIEEAAIEHNVYVGICPRREALDATTRGTNEDAAALPGVWADLDVQGDAHEKGAPSLEAAHALLRDFGIAPTVIVSTGHGLQAYWLLREPWTFADETERLKAALLTRGVGKALQDAARAAGWSLDNLCDLSRVFRVPGTRNLKVEGKPEPVELLTLDGPRYAVEDFEPFVQGLGKAGALAADNGRMIPLGKAARRFVVEGAPDGEQATRAIAAARNMREAGWERERVVDLVWMGLQACEQRPHDPWTYEHAERFAERVFSTDAPPLSPLESEAAADAYRLEDAKERAQKIAAEIADSGRAPDAFAQAALRAFAEAWDCPDARAAITATLKGKFGATFNLNDFRAAVGQAQKKQAPSGGDAPRFRERDGAYWAQRKDGWHALSNFVLQLRERLMLPDGSEVLAVTLRVQGQAPTDLDLPHHVFIRGTDLLKALRTSKAVWHGSDSDVQLLRAHLLTQDAVERRGVECVGRHGDQIVLPGVVLTRDGPQGESDVQFVDLLNDNPAASLLTDQGKYPLALPTTEEHKAAAEAVFAYLPLVHGPQITIPFLGWIGALPWREPIHNAPSWGGFPIINMFGRTGAGKSETSKLLWRVTGVRRRDQISAEQTTPFARLKHYASSNVVPTFIDEYSSGLGKLKVAKIQDELKNAYLGSSGERGKSDLTARRYPMMSPIILAGEDRPTDPAAQFRMLPLNPRIADRNEEAFVAAGAAPLEAFALPYWTWALAQDEWLADLNAARQEVRAWVEREGFVVEDGRTRNNLSIVLFGWRMLERYGETLGLAAAKPQRGDLWGALRALLKEMLPRGKKRDNLDDLFVVLHTMATAGRLHNKQHYAIDSDGNMVVLLKVAVAEAHRYARETESDTSLYSVEAYERLAKEAAERGDGYILGLSTRARFTNGRQLRGLHVDVLALEEQCELDAAVWDTQSEGSIAVPAAKLGR